MRARVQRCLHRRGQFQPAAAGELRIAAFHGFSVNGQLRREWSVPHSPLACPLYSPLSSPILFRLVSHLSHLSPCTLLVSSLLFRLPSPLSVIDPPALSLYSLFSSLFSSPISCLVSSLPSSHIISLLTLLISSLLPPTGDRPVPALAELGDGDAAGGRGSVGGGRDAGGLRVLGGEVVGGGKRMMRSSHSGEKSFRQSC